MATINYPSPGAPSRPSTCRVQDARAGRGRRWEGTVLINVASREETFLIGSRSASRARTDIAFLPHPAREIRWKSVSPFQQRRYDNETSFINYRDDETKRRASSDRVRRRKDRRRLDSTSSGTRNFREEGRTFLVNLKRCRIMPLAGEHSAQTLVETLSVGTLAASLIAPRSLGQSRDNRDRALPPPRVDESSGGRGGLQLVIAAERSLATK